MLKYQNVLLFLLTLRPLYFSDDILFFISAHMYFCRRICFLASAYDAQTFTYYIYAFEQCSKKLPIMHNIIYYFKYASKFYNLQFLTGVSECIHTGVCILLTVLLEYINYYLMQLKCIYIVLALCLMLSGTYYAKNYAVMHNWLGPIYFPIIYRFSHYLCECICIYLCAYHYLYCIYSSSYVHSY